MAEPGQPRDFQAPEILAALQKLTADLTAARADIRALSERVTRQQTRGTAGTAGGASEGQIARETQQTTAAKEGDVAARRAAVAEGQMELDVERAIGQQIRQNAMARKYLAAPMPAGIAQEAAQGGRNPNAYRGSLGGPLGVTAWQPRNPNSRGGANFERWAAQSGSLPGGGTAKTAAQLEAELAATTAKTTQFGAASQKAGAMSNKFFADVAHGRASIGQLGSEMAATMGKFAGWTAAATGVFAMVGAIGALYRGAKEAQTGVQGLRRSLDNVSGDQAMAGFSNTAKDLNVSIKDVADAQFQMSRTFHSQNDSLTAARVGLLAYKLDNVSLADSVRALTAVHQQFGIQASQLPGFYDMIAEAQKHYNARASEMLPLINRASAAWKNAGGDLTQLTQIGAFALRVSGQTGTVVGNALARSASNFVNKPTNQAQIAALGLDPKEATRDFGAFMLEAIRAAQGKGGEFRNQLAKAIGGPQLGSRVIAPILGGDVKTLNDILANVNPEKAKGSAQEELQQKLKATDEVLKSIPHSLEQLGAELGRSGAFNLFGALILQTRSMIQEVTSLVKIFNGIPSPLRQGVLAMGELYAGLKLVRAIGLGDALVAHGAPSFLGRTPATVARRDAINNMDATLATMGGTAAASRTRGTALQSQAIQQKLWAEDQTILAAREANEAKRTRMYAAANEAATRSNAMQAEGAVALQQATLMDERMLQLQTDRLAIIRRQAVVGGATAASEGAATAASAGGLGSRAGGLLSRIGRGAMRGLVTGLIIQTIGDSIASGVGGKTGDTISRMSPWIAGGAGAGSIAGLPGAVVGAGVGAFAGVMTGATDTSGEKSMGSSNDALTKWRSDMEAIKDNITNMSPHQLRTVRGEVQALLTDPNLDKYHAQIKKSADEIDHLIRNWRRVKAEQASTNPHDFPGFAGVTADTLGKDKLEPAAGRLAVHGGGAGGADFGTLARSVAWSAFHWGQSNDPKELTAVVTAQDTFVKAVTDHAQRLLAAGNLTPGATRGLLRSARTQMQSGVGKLQGQVSDAQTELRNMIAQRDRTPAIAGEGGLPGPAGPLGPGGIRSGPSRQVLDARIIALRDRIKSLQAGVPDAQRAVGDAERKLAQAVLPLTTQQVQSQVALQNARTQDKGAQLRNTLAGDLQILAATAAAFKKNSMEYRAALTNALQAQQAVVQQALSDRSTANALTTSRISTPGVEGDIARARSTVAGLIRNRAYAQAHGADRVTLQQMTTQINDSQRSIAQQVTDRAKALSDAQFALSEASVLDPVARARMEYRHAVGGERGLSGLALAQQRASAAQAKQTLNQSRIDEQQKELQFEHDIGKLSDGAYIAQLQEIIRTKKLSNDQKRQLRLQIYQLQHGAGANADLNIGDIKLPTLYEVRRAVAGGSSVGGQTVVNHSPTVNVAVSRNVDLGQVGDVLDRALGTAIGLGRSRGAL